MRWSLRDRTIELSRPIVMGILNVTPDSFSDAGQFLSVESALAQGIRMLAEGADIIDVGGESTRPGAKAVDAEEELRRVVPVIEALTLERPDALISVDTVKSVVARAAIAAGATIVNDVSGLRLDADMGRACAETGVGLVLMHSRGAVEDMASLAYARYDDVVAETLRELEGSLNRAEIAGVEKGRIALDPGIGFSKTPRDSIHVLRVLPRLVSWGRPVVVGLSRKRFVGEVTGVRDPAARLSGTLGANIGALALGAHIFRVHDVRPHREALDVAWEILRQQALGTEAH